MPDINNFHAFKSTGGKTSGGGSCGRLIIAVSVVILCFFISNGASSDALDTLLGILFLAYLIFR